MTTVARVLEIVLGLFFVASAAMKALDVEAFAKAISAYGIVRDPAFVTTAAYCTLVIETVLGACFLARWRLKGIVYAAATALTVVFTVLIVYAWQVNGLEDCGCFGKTISMTPPQSIVKNIVLVALLSGAWFVLRTAPIPASSDQKIIPRVLSAAVSLLVVLGATVYSAVTAEPETYKATIVETEADRPFGAFHFDYEGRTYNLAEGEFLVAFLGASCPHCQASVEFLNAYPVSPELPELIALLQADSAEALEDFRLLTAPLFPTQPIDDLVFMEYLGDLTAPPRLSFIRDGREERFWAWEEDVEPPTPSEILEAIRP